MRLPRKCLCGGVLEPLYRRSMTNVDYPLVPLKYYICPRCGYLEDINRVKVVDPCRIGPLMLHLQV